MDWNKMERQGSLYGTGKRSSDQKRIQQYQVRMRRRPTRAEKRFKKIIYQYFGLNPDNMRSHYRKKAARQVVFQKMLHDTINNKWYIADFYLPQYKIVFEVDGKQHSRSLRYDALRSMFFATRGIKTFRINNATTHDEKQTMQFITNAINSKSLTLTSRKSVKLSRLQELKLQEDYIKKYGVTKCPNV